MKVLVGISGGVDSAVAALLLKEAGYEVIGATMVLYRNNTNINNLDSIVDSKKVCSKLGIEHHVINLEDEFKNKVINEFISVYKDGGTPNPCVLCNKYLKFGALWDYAKKIGCDYIATGHYARVSDGKILKSSSKEKDQSYFLYGIDKNIINNIIFPLDKFHDKDEVRRIAMKNDLIVHNKKDSQDICFIEDGNYALFLENNMEVLPDKGNFILKDGTVIGKHKGIIYYTIGQRKGLGLSYNKPLYVVSIDKESNSIVVGSEADLYNSELFCNNINMLVDKIPSDVKVKIRYKSMEVDAKLEIVGDDKIRVLFKEKQRAITKGQSVVFYDGDVLVGGGIIV